MELFLRNPSRIAGAKPHVATDYGTRGSGKESFAYLIQRLSDRKYTMRGVCLDDAGARYSTFSRSNIVYRSIAWHPDTNLDEHSSDDTILDTFHLDLFEPKSGKHVLAAETLSEAVKFDTECLFITNFAHLHGGNQEKYAQVIVKAIQTCSSNLKCISLNSSALTLEVFKALTKCKNLSGILIQDPHYDMKVKNDALDKALAKVVASCPLKWIYVEQGCPFHGECWKALGAGACPDLQVLWIDCPVYQNGRVKYTAGDHNTIRRVLAERNLDICMINPDEKIKSSYIPATGDKKATDRLTVVCDSPLEKRC